MSARFLDRLLGHKEKTRVEGVEEEEARSGDDGSQRSSHPSHRAVVSVSAFSR